MKSVLLHRSTSTIERIKLPTQDAFNKLHQSDYRPVIIEGLLEQWKAYQLWDSDYLKAVTSEFEVDVQISSDQIFRTNDRFNGSVSRLTMAEFFDKILMRQDEYYYYLRSLNLSTIPQLLQDIEIPYLIDQSRLTKIGLWISAAKSVTPLHYDCSHNILAQIRGRKRIILFPPKNLSNYYPYVKPKGAVLSQLEHNIRQPDFKKFPKFKNAQPVEYVLQEGEMIHIPAFWWHDVESLENGISVNFFWRTMPREEMHPYFQFMESQRYFLRNPYTFPNWLRYQKSVIKKWFRLNFPT
jgi:Cupin-like domain